VWVLRTHTTLKIGVLSNQPEQLQLSFLIDGFHFFFFFLKIFLICSKINPMSRTIKAPARIQFNGKRADELSNRDWAAM
jgi:hypothetical protein